MSPPSAAEAPLAMPATTSISPPSTLSAVDRPACILSDPPSKVLPALIEKMKSPDFPPRADPDDAVKLPDEPLDVVPVVHEIAPLTPDIPLFILFIMTWPLLLLLPDPVLKLTEPPVTTSESPACTVISPPGSDVDLPILTRISPPSPLVALPVEILMKPDAPNEAVPDEMDIPPDTPVDPALTVEIRISPLEDKVPSPALIDTDPPVMLLPRPETITNSPPSVLEAPVDAPDVMLIAPPTTESP